jgi:hypothetical protein
LLSRRVDALTEAFIRQRSEVLGWNTSAECVTEQEVHFDSPIRLGLGIDEVAQLISDEVAWPS